MTSLWKKAKFKLSKIVKRLLRDMSLTNYHVKKQKGENKNGCQHYKKNKKLKEQRRKEEALAGKIIHEN